MEWLKEFSSNYANGVSALVALTALLLAGTTLWMLRREFIHKYRPYVMAAVFVDPILNSKGFGVSIAPRNIGPHPCEFMLTGIRLIIGDENYETPSMSAWLLLAPHGVEIRVPAGHVNEIGIGKVRESRFKSNRVEVSFTLHTRSVEKRFAETTSISYEINVLGDVPFALFRPEWQKKA